MTRHGKFIVCIGIFLLSGVCTVFAGGKDKYEKGYYIDSTHNQVPGFIAFDGSSCYVFLFKKELGDKATMVTVAECSGFQTGNRTFRAIDGNDFVIWVRKRPLKRAFAELVDDGEIQLYKLSLELATMDAVHKVTNKSASVAGGDVGKGVTGYLGKKRIYYFLKKQTTDEYTRIESRKSHFRRQMEEYLANDTALIMKLDKNKDYSYNNIEAVIQEYNEDVKKAAGK
jgi:hypothetical protein